MKQAIAVADPDSEVFSESLQMHANDLSGTPVALIEAARRRARLEVRDAVEPEEILIEFPLGSVPKEQTGCSRFVRLRTGKYALVR
jgi:hypothetical protein